VDFGERREDKGCVLVELARGATNWRFQALAARPFISIEVDVRQSSDPQERIRVAIARHDVRQAVVRVEIKATREQVANLSEEPVRQQLEDGQAWVIAAVVIDIEREVRRRLAGAEEELMRGLSPRRALELYLRSKETDPQRIEALLSAADELLAEEDC
jgi:exonuclease SbcD